MELIVLLALVAGGIAIRKQGQRLNVLEQELAGFRLRLADDEPIAATPDGLLDQPTTSATAEEPASPVEIEEPAAAPGPWEPVAMSVADRPDRVGETPASEPAPNSGKTRRRDLETALGTRWAVWVGGLALALGGVFLVRYSIEAGVFGPRVRLAAGALFGLGLAAAGELARRRGFRAPIGGVNDAYVPAVLTAAATFTLFSTVFAAHALYGLIGTTMAFGLLAVTALGAMGLALLHGQALAGLGLLGSSLTPFLVSSDSPAVWTLFGYLAVVLVAAVAIAALRRWRFLAGAAYLGAGLWSLIYLSQSYTVEAAPPAFLGLIGLAALAGLWLARPEDEGESEGTAVSRLDPASLVAAIFLFVAATFLARGANGAPVGDGYWAAALLLAALAVAVWRARALPLLHAFGLATLFIAAWPIPGGSMDIDIVYGRLLFDGVWLQPGADAFRLWSFVLAGTMLAAGLAVVRLRVAAQPVAVAVWALWAVLVPLWTVLAAWLASGDLNIDWRFAFPALALAAILAAAAEFTARAEAPAQAGGRAVSCFVAGAALALCLALLAGFGPLLTTVLTGLASGLPALATRLRRWQALGWASAGFAAVTLARIGADPAIVGAHFLSATPFFNALTPGYALPAAAFAYAAWQLAHTTDRRPRLAMEAFAALFSLLGAAMLVRHAMNGGVIGPGEPFLAEQAIYSLIMIGGGAILLALDRRAPSPVFRWGSIGLGVVSVLTIASTHLLTLNPLFTNDTTGAVPVFNLLLLAYLLPALALAALAWRARGLRPDWYVALLAAGAVTLAFAWVSLSIRHLFHGEFIGAWKGMGAVETYTYSAVWLMLGVAALVAGLKLDSRALRFGSAGLVVLAVAKVFLYDMRELEGVLRALSFMGLGAVLIGIGMFYQRTLRVADAEES